jgi:hypothetical protein
MLIIWMPPIQTVIMSIEVIICLPLTASTDTYRPDSIIVWIDCYLPAINGTYLYVSHSVCNTVYTDSKMPALKSCVYGHLPYFL